MSTIGMNLSDSNRSCALLDHKHSSVGRDEAVFMLGACASFASYLWRKHAGGEAS